MGRLWQVVSRRKRLDPRALEDSRLARVLDACDLTALGVGSTLGVGVYVLAGQVAKNAAGPAVTLSFLFAAVASVFAGEYRTRVWSERIGSGGSVYLPHG
ncbi:hypothetical protein PR048_000623 [Dryococelus australis]|uniref:Uncharacterized protein n=1 Tax=Dryococelus australis TaxID=614101 RepID=A0ABQ9IHI8_9NEOP|nr:hypothetical protein PR048_000623 [Dryococelus australis]